MDIVQNVESTITGTLNYDEEQAKQYSEEELNILTQRPY